MKQVNSTEEFEKIIAEAGEKPVFVDFFAQWCGKCTMLMPEFEGVAQEKGDSVQFIKVDIEENEEIPEKYKVEALPYLICFKKGEQVGHMMGSKKEKYLEFIEKSLE